MFESHKLNAVGKGKVSNIREAFADLMNEVGGYCVNSRELSIAKTKLEEACMWAIKSVATNPENCE